MTYLVIVAHTHRALKFGKKWALDQGECKEFQIGVANQYFYLFGHLGFWAFGLDGLKACGLKGMRDSFFEHYVLVILQFTILVDNKVSIQYTN